MQLAEGQHLPRASLFGSGVPLDSPLEAHLLWDLALIMPGLPRRYVTCELVSGANDCICLQSQELAEGLHSATDQLAALQAVQGGDRRDLESRLAHVSHELEQSSADLAQCR